MTLKVLIIDLETTALQADRGHLLTACAKWLDSKEVLTWRIDDHKDYGKNPKSYMNDKWIVKGLIEVIDEADMLVGHYLDRFDVPFLNTRALIWGLRPAAQVKTIDTWKVAKNNLAMRSNRLATLTEHLNSKDGQKGGLSLDEWQIAGHGDKKTLDRILKYNIQDVLATEELYLNLRPIIKNHPYVAVPNGLGTSCPACGSNKTRSQGSYYTKLFRVKRRRCSVCSTQFEEGREKIQ